MSNKPFAIQDGITFPDGSIQTTAYSGGDSNVWVQTFVSETGSPTDIVAMAVSVEYDSAGNVIALFSHYNSNDNSTYYSVGKYTTTGVRIWTARFGDGFNTDGWGLAVSGNYIYVAGQTLPSSESGYRVSTLTKLDSSDGSIEWSKVYDFGYTSTSNVVDVASDGDPVMVGYVTEGDSYVSTVKVDAADGSIVWARLLDGQGNEEAYGMAVGPTGEVVAIGYMSQLGPEGDTDDHMLVVKYASDGTIAWQKAILFDAGYDCKGADADIDSDGNIYVTGSYQYVSELNGNTAALSILKLDSTGVKQWSRRVEGTCETFGVSVVVGADDKLYLSGVTAFAGYTGVGEPDLNNAFTWVVAKYGFDGTVEWQRLIDHIDSWSFAGDIWFGGETGGGSNLAVKDGYVVFGGGFGNQAGSEDPRATVAQVSASGDVFATGPWAFTAASFSGLLNSSASDITVVNAEKTDAASFMSVVTATPSTDISAFLLGTLYGGGGSASSITNGEYSVSLGADGSLTAPGNLQVDGGKLILNTGGNAYVESVDYGVNSANSAVNIFGGPYQKINLRAGFGTEATWTFGTDGTLTLPLGGDIKNSTTGASVLFSGDYDDLTSKPTLFDGNYNSLTNKPTIRIAVVGETGGPFGSNLQADSLALAGLNPTENIPSTWGGNLILQGGVGGANGDLYGEVRIKSGQIGANYEWHFTTDKKIKLPAGGNIVDSTGANIFVSLTTLKQVVADSTDFADFQSRIAGM